MFRNSDILYPKKFRNSDILYPKKVLRNFDILYPKEVFRNSFILYPKKFWNSYLLYPKKEFWHYLPKRSVPKFLNSLTEKSLEVLTFSTQKTCSKILIRFHSLVFLGTIFYTVFSFHFSWLIFQGKVRNECIRKLWISFYDQIGNKQN